MVKFKKLTLLNFMGVGNTPLVIQLDRNPITLITGTNGVGKSAITDSLTYVLFGRPYRNVNKKQLINSINGRGTLVEVEFSVKGKEYKIRRGIKPDVFEIFENNILINQEAANRDYQKHLEQNILGMNLKSFKQVVILSVTNYTPFMNLSASDRRAIIEDLLDIQVFSVMNEVLLERKTEIVELKRKLDQKIKLLIVEIRSQTEKIDSLKAKDQSMVESNINKIREVENLINERLASVEKLQEIVTYLNSTLLDKSELTEKKTKLKTMLTRLSDANKKLEKEIEFFNDNPSCPVCSQTISEELRTHMLKQKSSKADEVQRAASKVNIQFDDVTRLLLDTEEVASKIYDMNNEIIQLNSSVSMNQKYIKELEKTISEIQSKGDDEEQTERQSLFSLESKKTLLEDKLQKVLVKEDDYQVCQKLLKDDGIKTQIIEKYIPTINSILNHYLELFGFPISFTFDKTFNEVVRSRYRDEFSYSSFSSGERVRIDVCLVLTFREIAKLKNSISCSLLILDEIGESLDTPGMEKLLEILGGLRDTNCFMVSHKTEVAEVLHNRIHLKKDQGFTVISND